MATRLQLSSSTVASSSYLLEDCNGEVIRLSSDGLYLPRRSPLGPSEVHSGLRRVAQYFLSLYLFSEILQLFGEGHGPHSSFQAYYSLSGQWWQARKCWLWCVTRPLSLLLSATKSTEGSLSSFGGSVKNPLGHQPEDFWSGLSWQQIWGEKFLLSHLRRECKWDQQHGVAKILQCILP